MVTATRERTSAPTKKILDKARKRATEEGLPFAGTVTPEEAWKLVEAEVAILVDVRTEEEVRFVGGVPDAVNVEWAVLPQMRTNPDFLEELAEHAEPEQVVLFLCRSGQRSAAAARAATAAGYAHAFNIAEGFEGPLDAEQRRGTVGGWRFHGLPWVQD